MLRSSARFARVAPLIFSLSAFALALTPLAVKSVGILRNCSFPMPQPPLLCELGLWSFAEGSRGRNGARSARSVSFSFSAFGACNVAPLGCLGLCRGARRWVGGSWLRVRARAGVAISPSRPPLGSTERPVKPKRRSSRSSTAFALRIRPTKPGQAMSRGLWNALVTFT